MMQRCPTAAVGRVLVSQRHPGSAELFITLLNPLLWVEAVPSMGRQSNLDYHAIVMVNHCIKLGVINK